MFVSETHTGYSYSNTVTASMPSGMTTGTGRYVFVTTTWHSGSATITASAGDVALGMVQVGTSQRGGTTVTWWKAPYSASLNFVFSSTASDYCCAQVLGHSGLTGTLSFANVTGFAGSSSTSPATLTLAGGTATAGDDLITLFAIDTGNSDQWFYANGTATAGTFTDLPGGRAQNAQTGAQYINAAAAGATGSASIVATTSVGTPAYISIDYAGIFIAAKATSAPTPPTYTVTAASGSFALTGKPVTFVDTRYNYVLALGTGSFDLTGFGGTPSLGYVLTAARGLFALTGQTAGFNYSGAGATRTLTAARGLFALSGNAAGLTRGRTLSAGQGALALTGKPVNLTRGRVLAAAQGSLALSGKAVAFARARALIAAQAAFALAGNAAGLSRARMLSAGQGGITLTGEPAGLVYAQPGHYAITAARGAFVLSGQVAGLVMARRLFAAQGSAALTGVAAGLRLGRRLGAAFGTLALSGEPVALTYSQVGHYTLTAVRGAFQLTGGPASLSRTQPTGYVLSAALGRVFLQGKVAALTYSGGPTYTPAGPHFRAPMTDLRAANYNAPMTDLRNRTTNEAEAA